MFKFLVRGAEMLHRILFGAPVQEFDVPPAPQKIIPIGDRRLMCYDEAVVPGTVQVYECGQGIQVYGDLSNFGQAGDTAEVHGFVPARPERQSTQKG